MSAAQVGSKVFYDPFNGMQERATRVVTQTTGYPTHVAASNRHPDNPRAQTPFDTVNIPTTIATAKPGSGSNGRITYTRIVPSDSIDHRNSVERLVPGDVCFVEGKTKTSCYRHGVRYDDPGSGSNNAVSSGTTHLRGHDSIDRIKSIRALNEEMRETCFFEKTTLGAKQYTFDALGPMHVADPAAVNYVLEKIGFSPDGVVLGTDEASMDVDGMGRDHAAYNIVVQGKALTNNGIPHDLDSHYVTKLSDFYKSSPDELKKTLNSQNLLKPSKSALEVIRTKSPWQAFDPLARPRDTFFVGLYATERTKKVNGTDKDGIEYFLKTVTSRQLSRAHAAAYIDPLSGDIKYREYGSLKYTEHDVFDPKYCPDMLCSFLVGAWKIGSVVDSKAAKQKYTTGLPQERCEKVSLFVETEWMHAIHLVLRYGPPFSTLYEPEKGPGSWSYFDHEIQQITDKRTKLQLWFISQSGDPSVMDDVAKTIVSKFGIFLAGSLHLKDCMTDNQFGIDNGGIQMLYNKKIHTHPKIKEAFTKMYGLKAEEESLTRKIRMLRKECADLINAYIDDRTETANKDAVINWWANNKTYVLSLRTRLRYIYTTESKATVDSFTALADLSKIRLEIITILMNSKSLFHTYWMKQDTTTQKYAFVDFTTKVSSAFDDGSLLDDLEFEPTDMDADLDAFVTTHMHSSVSAPSSAPSAPPPNLASTQVSSSASAAIPVPDPAPAPAQAPAPAPVQVSTSAPAPCASAPSASALSASAPSAPAAASASSAPASAPVSSSSASLSGADEVGTETDVGAGVGATSRPSRRRRRDTYGDL